MAIVAQPIIGGGNTYGFAFPVNVRNKKYSPIGFTIRTNDTPPSLKDKYNSFYWNRSLGDLTAKYKSANYGKVSIKNKTLTREYYAKQEAADVYDKYFGKLIEAGKFGVSFSGNYGGGYCHPASNVLPNCVSYCNARFNEIYAEMAGLDYDSKLPYNLNWDNTSVKEHAISQGLTIDNSISPTPGALMFCVEHHVLIVEEVLSPTEIMISESWANASDTYYNDSDRAYHCFKMTRSSPTSNTWKGSYGTYQSAGFVRQPLTSSVSQHEKEYPTDDKIWTFPAFGRIARKYTDGCVYAPSNGYTFNEEEKFTVRDYAPRLSDYYNQLYWMPCDAENEGMYHVSELYYRNQQGKCGNYITNWLKSNDVEEWEFDKKYPNWWGKMSWRSSNLSGVVPFVKAGYPNTEPPVVYGKITPAYTHGNILPSNKGYAISRFSEITAERNRDKSPYLSSPFTFNEYYKDEEMKNIKSKPRAGSMMVWFNQTNEDSDNNKDKKMVASTVFAAIVEKIDKDDSTGTVLNISYSGVGEYDFSSVDKIPTPGSIWRVSKIRKEPIKDSAGNEIGAKWKLITNIGDPNDKGKDFPEVLVESLGNKEPVKTIPTFRGYFYQPDIKKELEPQNIYLNFLVGRYEYEDQLRIWHINDPVKALTKPDINEDTLFRLIPGIYKIYETKTVGPNVYYKIHENKDYWLLFKPNQMVVLPKQEYVKDSNIIYRDNSESLISGNKNSQIKKFESSSLLSDKARVQVPFIKVQMGGYTFGVFSKSEKIDIDGVSRIARIQFPNYITSLSVKKINGQVNTYTLQLEYLPTGFNDPNFFEKLFGQVGLGGKITFSYGDCSVPTYLYKNEEAIITKVDSSFTASSAISYTITAVSTSVQLNSEVKSWPERYAQPSTIIKDILYNKAYGIQEVFAGMKDKRVNEENMLIPSNDASVLIKAKTATPLDYINYLVKCMKPVDGSPGVYNLIVVDDTTGKFDGSYFKISLFANNWIDDIASYGIYSVDVNYPSGDHVMRFSTKGDYTYALYAKYNGSLSDEKYTRRFDYNGNLIEVEDNPLYKNSSQSGVTPELSAWMAQVTSYPISGTLEIQGLLRPAMLMQYLQINVWIHGEKHTSSGIYVITSQQDSISGSGFKTTLEVTRVKGDSDYNLVDARNLVNSNTNKFTWEDEVSLRKEFNKKNKAKLSNTTGNKDTRNLITINGQELVEELNIVYGADANIYYDEYFQVGNWDSATTIDGKALTPEQKVVLRIAKLKSEGYDFNNDSSIGRGGGGFYDDSSTGRGGGSF